MSTQTEAVHPRDRAHGIGLKIFGGAIILAGLGILWQAYEGREALGEFFSAAFQSKYEENGGRLIMELILLGLATPTIYRIAKKTSTVFF